MRSHEHSTSNNPEQQSNTPEKVLRGVMDRRGISWELAAESGIDPIFVRRDFLAPDGRMLRLMGQLPSESLSGIFWRSWSLKMSRPLASAELLEMTNSRTSSDERWQHHFELENRGDEEQVFEGKSEIPLGSSIVEALAATIEGSQPLGDSMYYAMLDSAQMVKIVPDILPDKDYSA